MNRNMSQKWVPAIAGMIIALLFSSWLMFSTFSYNANTHEIRIATKLWSDFGAHIPLIRSFSYGANLTRLLHGYAVESPLFPGEPIRYHFGFYALAGMLERIGFRIDWALNLPSIIGFFSLLLLIFYLCGRLFHDTRVAVLSVLFFLFNGSLTWAKFLSDHPLSTLSIVDIVTNNKFSSFAPWDGGLISAFWTLNIYTNQRHLALSYALLLIILSILYMKPHITRRMSLLTGLCFSLLLFINFAAAGIATLFLGWMFVNQKNLRPGLWISAAISLPAFFFLQHVSFATSEVAWQPGYLMQQPITPASFLSFWFANLGLHSILIPTGLILSPKSVRRYLMFPLMMLFVMPNLFRFSPDMINNHKFFNFFLIIGNMFSAYAVLRIVRAFGKVKKPFLRIVLQLFISSSLIITLTISGVIDFFPIINDTKGSIPDIGVNKDATFILRHTNPDDIIANSTWFYHPASVAGRPLLSGYTYFTWSYGYDQAHKEALLTAIYRAKTVASMCRAAKRAHVSFVELNQTPEAYVKPNWDIWHSLTPAYENPDTHLTIYSIAYVCAETTD